MKGWIAKRVTELLGLEDEVVIGYIFEQLEDKSVRGSSFAYVVIFADHIDYQRLACTTRLNINVCFADSGSQDFADQPHWLSGEEYKPLCEGELPVVVCAISGYASFFHPVVVDYACPFLPCAAHCLLGIIIRIKCA